LEGSPGRSFRPTKAHERREPSGEAVFGNGEAAVAEICLESVFLDIVADCEGGRAVGHFGQSVPFSIFLPFGGRIVATKLATFHMSSGFMMSRQAPIPE
jgi:hypothetical protein